MEKVINDTTTACACQTQMYCPKLFPHSNFLCLSFLFASSSSLRLLSSIRSPQMPFAIHQSHSFRVVVLFWPPLHVQHGFLRICATANNIAQMHTRSTHQAVHRREEAVGVVAAVHQRLLVLHHRRTHQTMRHISMAIIRCATTASAAGCMQFDAVPEQFTTVEFPAPFVVGQFKGWNHRSHQHCTITTAIYAIDDTARWARKLSPNKVFYKLIPFQGKFPLFPSIPYSRLLLSVHHDPILDVAQNLVPFVFHAVMPLVIVQGCGHCCCWDQY